MILDTNAFSAFADDDPDVLPHIAAAEELHVPAIVLGDYCFGIAASRHRRDYERWLAKGAAYWHFLPIIEETTACYAEIRRELRSAGTPIPANDVWIAALARQHRLPVLTRDAHFDAVKGLERTGW